MYLVLALRVSDMTLPGALSALVIIFILLVMAENDNKTYGELENKNDRQQ